MLDCLHLTRHFHSLILNCSDAIMSVFYSQSFNAQPDIFAVMNRGVIALSAFSSDILTRRADSLYSV